jgi:hypothetical protein
MTSQAKQAGPATPSPRGRRWSVVAWGLWAVVLVMVGVGIAMTDVGAGGDLFQTLTMALAALSASTVGALVITRFPRNTIGWVLFAGGLAAGVSLGASSLAAYGLLEHPGAVPAAVWFLWLGNLTWLPNLILLAFWLPLLFPNGHLPSPRWRALAAIGVFSMVAGSINNAVQPFSSTVPDSVRNPLELGPAAESVMAAIGGVVTVMGIIALPLAAASLVVRYRRASGVERLQLKWFAYVVGLMAPALAVGLILGGYSTGPLGAISTAAWAIVTLGLGLLPAAVGLAVLRYRLYSIDVVIRRTIVYGPLALLLGGAYICSILLLSTVFAPITRGNSVAVAASTLLVAGLFQPVRRRIQAGVDRRFYRSRYDAARELAGLSRQLVSEMDLDGVRRGVVEMIDRTLQPASVAVWLSRRHDRQGVD